MSWNLTSRLERYRDWLYPRVRWWWKNISLIGKIVFWRHIAVTLAPAVGQSILLVIEEGCSEIKESLRIAGEWKLNQLIKWSLITGTILFFLLVATIYILLAIPGTQVATHAPVDHIRYLDQNWGPYGSSEYRKTYYHTPQGTTMLGIPLRYKWLVHLEDEDGKRFIEPEHMRALGFLVDPSPTEANPDHLPVGFARHYDPVIKEDVLDLTCALCHSGELHIQQEGRDVGIRIDGGQAMHAVTSPALGQFGPTLVASMGATLFWPPRFNRFARNVLGNDHYDERFALWKDMYGVFHDLFWRGMDTTTLGLSPVEEGFGRTDAVGRISNQVFGIELDPKNLRPANAPVSYPALWDAPRFDWVQYTGSVSQPMSRNLGESLGVGANVGLVNPYGQPIPPEQRFTSSSILANLHKIEQTIRTLGQPEWPEDLLGKIDTAKSARGKALFDAHCAHCHVPCLETPQDMAIERPDAKNPLWKVNLIPIGEVGTDPRAALNFYNVRVDLTKTGLDAATVLDTVGAVLNEQKDRTVKAYNLDTKAIAALDCQIKQKLDTLKVDSMSIGAGLNVLGLMLSKRMYKDIGLTSQEQRDYNGDGALDTPQVLLVYKARPLGGVWATGPYLHNGSVPTLYDMLVPAAERTKTFFITSRMYFDPLRVGLVTAPTADKGFWLDTTIPGNRNIGHEFKAGYQPGAGRGIIGPELTDQERWDIIEYLKVHRDNPVACKPEPPQIPPACSKGGQ